MLAYLLLASQSGIPVDPALVARLDQDDPPEVPFHPEERIVWKNKNGSTVFFGWQAFTEVAGIGSHWTMDEQGTLTAFTGHCWPNDTGWKHGTGQSWASQLQTWLADRTDLDTIRESLFGVFTILSLSPTGSGWVLPDWANVDELFFADHPDVVAISNRAGLCARAVGDVDMPPRTSLLAAGWLIGIGSILDEESGYWDVERPRAGSYVTVQPERGVTVVRPRRSPLFPRPGFDTERTYDDVLDIVEHDIRSTIRALAALPISERTFSLSGGKDSRTLLAFVLDEGVQDRFRFVTIGSPERADVIAAQAVAKRYDLDWSYLDMSAQQPAAELENSRFYTNLVEGMTSAWSTMPRPVFSPGLIVSGVAGEGLLWTTTASAAIGDSSLTAVVKKLQQRRPPDRLGILHPDVRSYYSGFIDDLLYDQAAHGVPLVSLPAVHRYEEFLHNRFGPDTAWNAPMHILAYSTPVCMRSNHWIPIDNRPESRFHVDLQRRTVPELSTIPFAEWTWPEDSIAHLPDAEGYRKIVPVISNHPEGRTWRQKRYQDFRPLIEEIVLDRTNPIHELLDYDRLVERVATGGEHPGRTRHVWGLLTATIWMDQHSTQSAKLTRG